MHPAEYEKMYDLEGSYWWFQGRRQVVLGLLDRLPGFREGGARILDVGCGTGLMLEHLNRAHWALGLDFSPLALGFSRKRGARLLTRGDAQTLPLRDKQFDIVTALDLAEHLTRDDLFFAEVFRVLRPGGTLVLTVPAHPFLWSDHDEALYHQRRYTRSLLTQRVREAGFEIERITYCITLTYPMIVGFRLMQRLLAKADHPKTHLIVLPRWANRLLTWSVRFEAAVMRWCNLPFGVTLAAVARKPQSPRADS